MSGRPDAPVLLAGWQPEMLAVPGLLPGPVPWLLALPLLWAVLSLLLTVTARNRLLWLLVLAMTAVTGWLWAVVARLGAQPHHVGDWGAPLGIVLRADGPAVVFIAATTLVASAVAAYARRALAGQESDRYFWPLFAFLWAGLNAIWLAGDLFNLYVGLELVGLAAVGLTALGGAGAALAAALRYLFAALLGSLAWLLGVALLYTAHGVLDLSLLGGLLRPGPTVAVALALMTAGLLLKSALFPLHGWLPPAHAGALAPVSALLSALVIMASFYALARLWLELGPRLSSTGQLSANHLGWAMQLLGGLGAAAVVWGGWQALRQVELKQVVAWSTVAQIGYFFLLFPLAIGTAPAAAALGWHGATVLVLGHALAKAGMFLAAGNLVLAMGSPSVAALAGVGHFLPRSLFAFGLAGVSLMGLPPSAGFTGKWLLLQSALASGQWWWIAVLLLGGLLTAGYVFRVFQKSFLEGPESDVFRHPPLQLDLIALALAAASIVLGLAAMPVIELLTPMAASAAFEVGE